jgi:hypothetical protein
VHLDGRPKGNSILKYYFCTLKPRPHSVGNHSFIGYEIDNKILFSLTSQKIEFKNRRQGRIKTSTITLLTVNVKLEVVSWWK